MAQIKDTSTVSGKSLLDYFYPIGTVYETMDSSFNPSTFWGGTWERVKGKTLVGVDEDDTDFASSNKTGGEKSHTLTVAEMPVHNHGIAGKTSGNEASGYSLYPGSGGFTNRVLVSSATADKGRMSTYNTGGGSAQQYASLHHCIYLEENCLKKFFIEKSFFLVLRKVYYLVF